MIDAVRSGLRVRPLLLVFGLLASAPACRAMSAEPEGLPRVRELAAALSEPASRTDTLLTLIALSRLLERAPPASADAVAPAVEAFVDDRAWLDRLAARHAQLPTRSTVLDPAAWFLQLELARRGIHPSHDNSPLGPEFPVLAARMFERSDERLAAALLPEALFHAEREAVSLWRQFQQRVALSEPYRRIAADLNGDWFDPWLAAEPPAPQRGRRGGAPLADAIESLRLMGWALVQPGPPDALRARRLRFDLQAAMPELGPEDARVAAQVLRLAVALEGLHEGHYLEFTQSLLWAATDLFDSHIHAPAGAPALAPWIADFVPRVSAALSREFNAVDPRLNSNLATAFDVAQELMDGEPGTGGPERLQAELADAMAQMVLLAPDFAFYFDQPVRRNVAERIDSCVAVAAARDAAGRPALTRQQFDGCLEGLVAMVDAQLRNAELAGQPRGPYGIQQLRRELELMPWQRVNYLFGYLHELAPSACVAPDDALPNPLEWAVLASVVAWFVAEAPVFLRTPENEALLERLEQRGIDLTRAMARQEDCIAGSATGPRDPVNLVLARYRDALEKLVQGVRSAEIAFRAERLRPGADIVLGGDVTQPTGYRPQELTIGPCARERTCEMTQPLEATRALSGLFPDLYLVADQSGLGSVEICYDDVAWVERRSEPVRSDQPAVSNYYGRFSFGLYGRYREGTEVETVFGARFVSPDEYRYLIAATDSAIREDACPSEWVGERIVTSRAQRKNLRLVPDRLTYLAAARHRPSELMLSNWSRGAEWRDWFVTGSGIERLAFTPDPGLADRLAAHLRTLYQAGQQSVYGALLRPPERATPARARAELHELLADVTTYKSLLRSMLVLMHPETLLESDAIRAMTEGQNGLLDESIVRGLRSFNAPVSVIQQAGNERLQRFETLWNEQPEALLRSGSVGVAVAHAMARLGQVVRAHFAVPAVLPAPALEDSPSGQ